MELIAFQVHSDSFQQSDLNVCLKFSLRILPSGKFHLLTAAQGCLKLINYEKTDHESGTCPGRRQKLC